MVQRGWLLGMVPIELQSSCNWRSGKSGSWDRSYGRRSILLMSVLVLIMGLSPAGLNFV
jgi:hypothetical protein